MRVGFIGLGSMGLPMALSLLRSGQDLVVYNRTRQRAEELATGGAEIAESPAAAARGADVLVTMLSDDRAVEAVMLGGDGALAALPAGAVHASMSTIGVGLSKRLEALHHQAGQGYVAAPVFGRPEAAEAAKLWVIAAGAADAVERCRPLFDAMSQGTRVVGQDPVAANTVKIAGNFVMAAMLETLGEAFALVRKSGIEAAEFLDIVNGLVFKSPVYQSYGTLIAQRRFQPAGFRLSLGLKDVRLALEAADAVAAPLPVGGLVHDHLLSAVARGKAELDWAALGEVAAERAGL